ncbi:MAG: replication-relaxation family protein [Chthonomonadales bacterium]
MKANGDAVVRKRRYLPTSNSAEPITQNGICILGHIARLDILTVNQLSLLVSRSEQSVRRDLRRLFDGGMVRITLIPRALLETSGVDPIRDSFGSAPNCYSVSTKGIRLLDSLGMECPDTPPPPLGPANWLFVRHELAVRDVVIHFLRSAAAYPSHEVEQLHLGPDAIMDLARHAVPKTARPDAWLLYRFGSRVLVALLEYDTGSEKGAKRWTEKLTAFRHLLSSSRLHAITGHSFGRVVVVCRTAARRDNLAELIAQHAEASLAERFWVAAKSDMLEPDLSLPIWRNSKSKNLVPLIPEDLFTEGT